MELEAVDLIDRKIIDQLRSDGRRSFGQIARYVGLSEGSVRQRYYRLRSLGVVQVVGMPNSPRLGYVEAHLSIAVRGTTADSVAHALAGFREVRYVGACIGSFDLTVDVRCDDQNQMNRFLTETVRTVPGIASLETETLLEVIKDEYVWSGFREPRTVPTRPHPSTGF